MQSYATYVAATIHVRMAAQRSHPEAPSQLRVCLAALEENSVTNPGVKRMHRAITGLMSRLGVAIEVTSVGETLDLSSGLEGFDLDAVIRWVESGPYACQDD